LWLLLLLLLLLSVTARLLNGSTRQHWLQQAGWAVTGLQQLTMYTRGCDLAHSVRYAMHSMQDNLIMMVPTSQPRMPDLILASTFAFFSMAANTSTM
jgi:hypothetical protein